MVSSYASTRSEPLPAIASTIDRAADAPERGIVLDHADHPLQDSDVAGDLAHLLGCRQGRLRVGASGDMCHAGP